MSGRMRVAVVHERFTESGGSERVVEALHAQWPDATLFAPIVDRRTLPPGLVGTEIRTSPLQRLYQGGPSYAHLLPMLPLAMATFDLGDFDLVITSHHAFANRVRCRPGATLVSYTHTPGRWLWDPAVIASENGSRPARLGLAAFAATQRRADRRAAQRPDTVVVNSRHVAEQVLRWWGRSATVVPPPANVDFHSPDPAVEPEDFFLLAGRLIPYKRPEVAVVAARRAGVRLVVVGTGRSAQRLARLAGPGIELVGAVDDVTLRDLYRRCRALVLPGVEDFGLVPVEAQACGTPVLARAAGGALDSVVDGVTGSLYRPRPGEDEVDALVREIQAFDPSSFDRRTIRRHAESFSPEVFRARMSGVVNAAMGVKGPTPESPLVRLPD